MCIDRFAIYIDHGIAGVWEAEWCRGHDLICSFTMLILVLNTWIATVYNYGPASTSLPNVTIYIVGDHGSHKRFLGPKKL